MTSGQSVNDVYVDTKFQSQRVSINLGRVTVVKNLGATMILGEPDREGQYLAKPYLDQSGTSSAICRVQVASACLQCLSTVRLPKALIEDTTNIPEGLGTSFAADVLERSNQCVFICKEIFTQFTSAVIIPDQTANSMREALVQTVAPLISLQGAQVRVDCASAFQSLAKTQKDDPILKALGLSICLGNSLNVNKNPSAESTVGEVKRELLHLSQINQPISQATLSLAVHNLNNRVRAEGKSARELLTKRDMMTRSDIVIEDDKVKDNIETRRAKQHEANAKSRGKTSQVIEKIQFDPGDVVMYRDLQDYNKPRDTFIVVEHTSEMVTIRKMTNQLRMKTYEVRPEKLILVFKPSRKVDQQPPAEILTPPKSPAEDKSTKREIRGRSSKTKANIGIKDMASAGVINIEQEEAKPKRRREVWDFLVISQPNPHRQAADEDLLDDDDDDLDFGEDLQELFEVDHMIPPLIDDDDDAMTDNDNDEVFYDDVHDGSNDERMDEIVRQNDEDEYLSVFDSSEYGSPMPSPTANLNRAFFDQSSWLSVETMSPNTREELAKDLEGTDTDTESHPSLAWDNSEMLTNLSDPLENTNLYSPSRDTVDEEEREDGIDFDDPSILESSWRSSTPARVTRSMVSSGEYELTMSPIPFVRNSRLRRPVVRWQNTASPISDTGAAAATRQPGRSVRR